MSTPLFPDVTLPGPRDCLNTDLCHFTRHRPNRRSHTWQLPQGSGVYALLLNGTIVYIGMSSQIAARVKQHRNKRIPVDEVLALECDESTARAIERMLIGKYNPHFNTLLRSR